MHKSLLLLTAAAGLTLTASAQVFVTSDDFNDNSRDAARWTLSSFTTAGSAMTEANGRTEFTTTNTSGAAQGGIRSVPFNSGPTNWTNSWQLTVDATNNVNPSSLVSGQTIRAAMDIWVNGPTGGFPTLSIGLRSDGTGQHQYIRMLNTYTTTSTPNAIVDFDLGNVSSTTAALRFTFDAATKTLSAGYSLDNRANFTTMYSIDLDSGATGAWINESDLPTYGFGMNVWGYAANSAVTPGQVSWDNFSVSAIPEPSTDAAIAGVAGLGLAGWRRRRRA